MKLYPNADQIVADQVREVGLPEQLIPILHRLTHTRRGWLLRKVNEDGTMENALQHTAKLSLAAAAINPAKWHIDSNTLRKEVLIHELPEILGVDWVPGEISIAEKLRIEEEQIEAVLPTDFPRRAEIIQLWLDYEKGGLAYYLDKMDAVITAEYYALTNPQYLPVADEFFQHVQTKIQDETLIEIMKKIRQMGRSKENQLTPATIFPTYFELLKNC